MLNSLLGLYRGINSCCSSRFDIVLVMVQRIGKLYRILPAAAAGSRPEAFFSSKPGLEESFLGKGLRLRRDSACRLEGDLERRSNLEERLISGSV